MEDVRIVERGLADAEELAEIGRETFLDTYSADTAPADLRKFLSEAYRHEMIRARARGARVALLCRPRRECCGRLSEAQHG
jgi:hypothetical protein